MKIYFAPLEGITGYIYRRAYDECYGKGKIDKYFIPFIAPNKNGSFTSMNMNNISPDNNIGINAITAIAIRIPILGVRIPDAMDVVNSEFLKKSILDIILFNTF